MFRIFKELMTRQMSVTSSQKTGSQYSNKFKYSLPFFCGVGGAREDRTPDLLRARQALSQLSYGPELFGGSGKI